MPGEQVMLQGRFFSQLRKLGAIGITTTAVVGILATSVYFRRAKAMHIFNTTWSKEDDQKLSDRVLKYQGYEKHPKYPNMPVVDNKGGVYDKLFETYSKAGIYMHLENSLLKKVDPTITPTLAKIILDDISGDYFDSESDREAAVKRLMSAREQVLQLPKWNDMSSNISKFVYVYILKSQADKVEGHSIARSLFNLDQ